MSTPSSKNRKPANHKNTTKTLIPGPWAPADIARELINLHYKRKGSRDLILSWRGDIYIWESGLWVLRDLDVVRSGLYKWLVRCKYKGKDGKPVPWLPNTTRVNQIVDALRSLVFFDERADPPCWLTEDEGYPASNLIPVKNGLLNPRTRRLRSHSPDHFNTTILPFAYNKDADAEEWTDYLETLWPDDPDSILLLQEIFGYIITGRLDMEKLFLMVGPKRSGRGTITGVLSALVGGTYVTNPTISGLSTHFGLESMIGKTLSVVGDLREDGSSSRKFSGSVAVERLLGISGQDPQDVHRKNKPDWNGLLPTRIIILSNVVPALPDDAGVIASRFEILKFKKSWLGEEDLSLKTKFKQPKYLPGILNWSLDGYKRLYKQGHFTKPRSSEVTRVSLESQSSPYPAFVEDCCELGAAFEEDKDLMYLAWQDWCALEGHESTKAGSKPWFSRGLMGSFPEVEESRQPTGMRMRIYRGIRLRDEFKANGVKARATDTRPGTSG